MLSSFLVGHLSNSVTDLQTRTIDANSSLSLWIFTGGKTPFKSHRIPLEYTILKEQVKTLFIFDRRSDMYLIMYLAIVELLYNVVLRCTDMYNNYIILHWNG